MRRLARWAFALTGAPRLAEAAQVSTDELIQRYQKGQPRAFEALYDRHKDYVFRVAFFVLRHREEAEDAVQETFLDVMRALPSYDVYGPARFETWLYRVTVNRCRMRLRRRLPDSEEWDDIAERLERLPAGQNGTPEQAHLVRERAQALWDAVSSLPLAHREAVILRYQQGLSYDEIAGALGIRVGTVRSRLFSAHAKLRKLLGGEGTAEGFRDGG